ncbi:MAG TPA: LuxR C-terminal-related transcriptional regulator [Microlunatus sp.]|nr:LuxR C-terminal-related transcriptional regulator [Microlunatus sp.]
MIGALLGTKMYVPKLRRGLVGRPRLMALMDAGVDARLTLVAAPAGFGKTTLLAGWLHAADRPVAWLSLDATDNEPVSFWTYVATALERAVPGVGRRALNDLAASSAPNDSVLTTLLNDLAAAPGEMWLVLDDYHLVDSHQINEGVAFLLKNLPPQAHVVISTRADPDLPLARWRVRGELVEVRAADLRFTSAEASAYLTAATGLDLAAADIAALEGRTEGWIAALQLAALSLQGRADASGFIARFTGDDRYIVDYLVEEVIQHQTDTVRRFLLQSSVLDRLTGPLCDAVTGGDDGSETLLALERANLFIVALDDRREWYRYHHLFVDVLRARMLSEQPDQVATLHLRASEWYEGQDLSDEAIRHALAGRHFDRAADLVELAASQIRRHRQEATMYGWLTALPDDVVRRRPVLSVFYGSMLMASGDVDAVEPRLVDAERALASVRDGAVPPWAETADLLTLPSTIAMYRAALAQARGDPAGTKEHAQRALALAGPNDHLARGGAAGFLGFAAWAGGDVPAALETFTQAVASLRAAGSLVDALTGTVVLGDLWVAAGLPSQARRLCAQALQVAEAHGSAVARATAELQVALSELDVEAGELDTARRHLEAAAALADRAGMNEGRYRWFVARGLLARADGELEAAVELLDQAAALYRPGFFPDVRPIPALTARIWVAQGDLTDANGWARDRGVSVTDDASYLHEFDHLTLVRLLLARQRASLDHDAADQVAGLLDRLRRAAEASGRAGSLLEIGMLLALVHDVRGRRRDALECLARAFAEAPEPGGYVRLFLDEGAPMVGLLRDAVHHGIARDHCQRLLSRTTPAADEPAHPGSADALSDRELQVLRLLDTELTGPEIARALFVSRNTLSTHTKHIFTKLGATSRRAAVLRAHERGLL